MSDMEISKKNNLTFTGYDARSFKALCLASPRLEIARELSAIAKKSGVDVFVASGNKVLPPEKLEKFEFVCHSPWAQDIAIVTPKNQFIADFQYSSYAKLLKEKFKKPLHLELSTPAGGNLYYIKDTDGKDILLAGSSAFFDFIEPARFENLYGIKKVDYIPQMDFHIDLFVRPLDHKRILIADDELTKFVLKKGLSKIHQLNKRTSNFDIFRKLSLNKIENNLNNALDKFEDAICENHYAKFDETSKILKSKGYKVYRVPGRIYDVNELTGDLDHSLNYMNAIVTKNKKNNLVYITNKSLFDKKIGLTPEIIKASGFSFENEFIKSVRPFVKRENIYFIEGKHSELSGILHDTGGGIHCLVTEIPK